VNAYRRLRLKSLLEILAFENLGYGCFAGQANEIIGAEL